MNRRRFLAAAATASTVGLAGCGAEGPPEVDEDDIVVTVSVLEDGFDPQVVHVEEGEAVQWRNERSERMEIESSSLEGAANWDYRDEASAGGTAAFLFEDSGAYVYNDRHFTVGEICGAVTVGDATEEDLPTLPCNEDNGTPGTTPSR